MKVALTGSTGMIGRHMKALLASKSIECVCIDREKWDLTSWKAFEEFDVLFHGVESIFHFGASLPKSSEMNEPDNEQNRIIFDANVRACLNLSEWANFNNIPIVFLSGATVYEDSLSESIKEGAGLVKSGFGGFYGYSKLLAEKVFDHFIENGLKVIILRPSSVYGIGLGEDKLISNCLKLAAKNKEITISCSKNRINLIHALDVSKAALLALENKAWGVYNIAAEKSPSIRELAECVVNVCDAGTVVINDESDKEKPSVRFDLDTSKAKDKFQFKQTVHLHDGLTLMYKQKEIEC